MTPRGPVRAAADHQSGSGREAREPGAIRPLVLTTSYPLQPDSGSGPFIGHLARELSRQSPVKVVTPAHHQPPAPARGPRVIAARYAPSAWQRVAHEPGGLPEAFAHRPWSRLLLPGLFTSLAWTARRHLDDVDVVHAQWSLCGALARIAVAGSRTPIVTTLRGSDLRRAGQSRLERAMLVQCLRYSACVTVVSRHMLDEIEARFGRPRARLAFVPNGVEATFLDVSKRTVEMPVRSLLCVGNLISDKGFDLVIQALPSRTDLELVIVGDGPAGPALRSLAREQGVADRVQFAGRLPASEMPGLYEAASACVLPSLAEGRPNVLVEAMAAARPVVASRLPGIAELVEDGQQGLLFAPGDAAGLGRALDRLVQEPRLAFELGNAGRRRIHDLGLTWAATARQFRDLYRDALEGAH